MDISKLSGVDPSGNLDSTSAVASALEQYGSIYIPLDARIKIDKLEMPPGSSIVGNGKIIYTDTNNPDDKTIRMYSDCQLIGPTKICGNTISLDYESQPLADSRGVNQETGPIVIGTWAYGTPAVSNQNTGMQVKDNLLIGSRDSKIGGSFATADAGFSTLTGGVISGNQCFGGTGLSIRRTLVLNLGVNYSQYSREDYKVSSSADNTNLKTLPA